MYKSRITMLKHTNQHFLSACWLCFVDCRPFCSHLSISEVCAFETWQEPFTELCALAWASYFLVYHCQSVHLDWLARRRNGASPGPV